MTKSGNNHIIMQVIHCNPMIFAV